MKKIFSFLAGAICGALVGGVTILLLTPASGESLRQEATARVQQALADAQQAREDKERELQAQFEQMKGG